MFCLLYELSRKMLRQFPKCHEKAPPDCSGRASLKNTLGSEKPPTCGFVRLVTVAILSNVLWSYL